MARSTIGVFGYGHLYNLADLSTSSHNDATKTYVGLKSVIAGGVSGATQLLVTYPIEYVKTQIQLDEKGHNSLYDGSWDCTKKTYERSGFFGFYRGVMITLCGYVQKVAVRFYVLELMRKTFEDSTGEFTTNMKLLSGLAAGSVEAIVAVTPFETLKTKFINDERSSKPQFHGLIHGVKTIIKNEGFRGIYLGYTPTILKEATNQAVRFSIVETLKEIYMGNDRNKRVPMTWTALFGALGGALSVACNNPIDVIKTRMQGLEAARYKNTLDCAMKIWKNEGPVAFYKGVFPRMTRVSIDVAITFMVYDKLMEWLHTIF